MKRIIAVIVTLVMCLSLTAYAEVPYGNELSPYTKEYKQKFADVPKSHWAFDQIMSMYEEGIFSGYPDGNFRPDRTITRAEASKVFMKASGLAQETYTGVYADVSSNDWYADYAETLMDYMTFYSKGNNSYFYGNTNITREDVAYTVVMLKGYQNNNWDLSILEAMFNDMESISSNMRKYVAIAIEQGLLSGFPDGTFRGQQTITRAELSAILHRAYKFGTPEKVTTSDTPDYEKKPVEQTNKPQVTQKEEPKVEEPTEVVEPEDTRIPATLTTVYEGDILAVLPITSTRAYIISSKKIEFYDNGSVKELLSSTKYPTETYVGDKYIQFSGAKILANKYYTEGENLVIKLETPLLNTLNCTSTVTFTPSGDYTFHYLDIQSSENGIGRDIWNSTDSFEQTVYQEVGYSDNTETLKYNGKTYMYYADSNKLIASDAVSGGLTETRVQLGLPSNKTIGKMETGFLVYGDLKIHAINLDGQHFVAFDPNNFNISINGNAVYNDIGHIEKCQNTYWIISKDYTKVRTLTITMD